MNSSRNAAESRSKLAGMHLDDILYILEVLPINPIAVNEPEMEIVKLVLTDTIQPNPDEEGKPVGCVTVNVMRDFIRTGLKTGLLNQAGLREDEDVFASA